MELASLYGHAIVAIVIYAFAANIMNAAVGINKGNANMEPGADFEPAGYDNPKWRLDRAYMNTIEMGMFSIALIVGAILSGASPFWVNLLASVVLVLRFATLFVYMRGIGKAYGGIRTGFAVLTAICNLGLLLLALVAVFA